MDLSVDVNKAIAKSLDEVSKKMKLVIEKDYAQYPSSMGKAEIDIDMIRQIAREEIALVFKAIGQRALILEYGKGSEMDKENPALDKYMNSAIFNKNRTHTDLRIRTRPKGIYYDLDGVPHESKTNANRELESSGNKKYAPIKPEHIVREAIKNQLKKIMGIVSEHVVQTAPLYKLIDGMEVNIKI